SREPSCASSRRRPPGLRTRRASVSTRLASNAWSRELVYTKSRQESANCKSWKSPCRTWRLAGAGGKSAPKGEARQRAEGFHTRPYPSGEAKRRGATYTLEFCEAIAKDLPKPVVIVGEVKVLELRRLVLTVISVTRVDAALHAVVLVGGPTVPDDSANADI